MYEKSGCRQLFRDQEVLQAQQSTPSPNKKDKKGVHAHPPQTQQCYVLRHHNAQEQAKLEKEKAKQANLKEAATESVVSEYKYLSLRECVFLSLSLHAYIELSLVS